MYSLGLILILVLSVLFSLFTYFLECFWGRSISLYFIFFLQFLSLSISLFCYFEIILSISENSNLFIVYDKFIIDFFTKDFYIVLNFFICGLLLIVFLIFFFVRMSNDSFRLNTIIETEAKVDKEEKSRKEQKEKQILWSKKRDEYEKIIKEQKGLLKKKSVKKSLREQEKEEELLKKKNDEKSRKEQKEKEELLKNNPIDNAVAVKRERIYRISKEVEKEFSAKGITDINVLLKNIELSIILEEKDVESKRIIDKNLLEETKIKLKEESENYSGKMFDKKEGFGSIQFDDIIETEAKVDKEEKSRKEEKEKEELLKRKLFEKSRKEQEKKWILEWWKKNKYSELFFIFFFIFFHLVSFFVLFFYCSEVFTTYNPHYGFDGLDIPNAVYSLSDDVFNFARIIDSIYNSYFFRFLGGRELSLRTKVFRIVLFCIVVVCIVGYVNTFSKK